MPRDPRPEMEREAKREAIRSMARLLVGFGAVMLVLVVLSWALRNDLERLGTWFVANLGAGGMIAGAFLADGLHFPIPPQFYLLAGIAGGFRWELSLLSVVIGSILGGFAAFRIARSAAGHRLLRERVRGPRRLVEGLLARHGYWGLAAAGLLPISYWFVCSITGLLRGPYRAAVVLALARVPRLVISYALIELAWSTTTP